MKFSISNIAWDKDEDESVSVLMKQYGFKGLEIAPTKIWDSPLNQTKENLSLYQNFWKINGINIVSMQSLLYNKPQFQIFQSETSYIEMKKYLKSIIDLGFHLGVKTLIFGSPKNRLVSNCNQDIKEKRMISFFRELGEHANSHNMSFCIEANPIKYGCDFVTTTHEALELVRRVNQQGFGLHLDTGTIILNNENIEDVIEKTIPYAKHIHISEPYLELIGTNYEQHIQIAQIIKKSNYNHWLSIEMKNNLLSPNLDAIKKAIHFVSNIYT